MPLRRDVPLEIKAADQRILTVAMAGDEAGFPVFLLHGTPGSRIGPKPRPSVLYRLGVRLITYDRPGYGGSTRKEDRRVADAAADVEVIARELGLTSFAVAGRSGGGPHALACAALLSSLVVRAAVLVSVAPSDAIGLDWFGGMTDANLEEFSAADTNASALALRLAMRAKRTAADPFSLLELLQSQMVESDRRVTTDVTIRRLLIDSYAEGLKDSPYGWIDDVAALRAAWGFRLGAIRCPVRLWHGVDDNFAPASHTRWLAGQIPRAELLLQADTAHFGAVEVLPSILAWLASTGPTDRRGSALA